MHQIQKHIIGILIHQEVARFSSLRPPRTDSNLFSYHLKTLIREGLVEKVPSGYTLTAQGLFLADRLSTEKLEPRLQPKIITACVLLDEAGRIGLQQRTKQPFINQWTVPSGKVHLGESPDDAVAREVYEKCGLQVSGAKHAGDAYVHAYQDDVLVSSVLMHVYRAAVGSTAADLQFVSPSDVADRQLVPGMRRLLQKTLAGESERFFVSLVSRR